MKPLRSQPTVAVAVLSAAVITGPASRNLTGRDMAPPAARPQVSETVTRTLVRWQVRPEDLTIEEAFLWELDEAERVRRMEQDPASPPAILRDWLMVQDRGRTLLFSGSARVFDQQPGGRWVWFARIHAGRRLVREYHSDPVSPPPGQHVLRLAYRKAIELEPGTYKVNLVLYRVSPDLRLDAVQPGEDLRAKADVRRSASWLVWIE